MQQEEESLPKKIFTSQQLKIHDQCYNLENNRSLQMMQSYQQKKTISQILNNNTIKLSNNLEQQSVDIYKVLPQQKPKEPNYIQRFLQTIGLHQTQHQMDIENDSDYEDIDDENDLDYEDDEENTPDDTQ